MGTLSPSCRHHVYPPTCSCPHMPSYYPGWIVSVPIKVQPLCVGSESHLLVPSQGLPLCDPFFSGIDSVCTGFGSFLCSIQTCSSVSHHEKCSLSVPNSSPPQNLWEEFSMLRVASYFLSLHSQPTPIRFYNPWEAVLGMITNYFCVVRSKLLCNPLSYSG